MNIKHGVFLNYGKKSPEYAAWESMLTRCNNKNATNYKNYGARGISVCERWKTSFPKFLADMGERPSPRHSLDRINNNGNYEPENCRWATIIEQKNNTRKNHFLFFRGESLTMAQWDKRFNLNGNLYMRIERLKWSVERAITTPLRKRFKSAK